MAFKLPRLQRTVALVDAKGMPTVAFHRWWQEVTQSLEGAIGDIQDNVDAILAAQAAAAAATAAAEVAQTAADNATDAAAAATTAATTAQAAAEGASSTSSLTASYPSGVTITSVDNGVDADIDISSHTRVYGDATSVSVDPDTLTGLTYGTKYYVYYDDVTRAGGAVTYVATTSQSTAAQTGDRHLVGSITTATSGGPLTNGTPLPPPGTSGL